MRQAIKNEEDDAPRGPVVSTRETGLPDARMAVGWTALGVMGLAMQAGSRPLARETGRWIAWMGAAGIAYWLWLCWRAWQVEQAAQVAASQRKALKEARRVRTAVAKQARREKKEQQAHVRSRRAEERALRRQRKVEEGLEAAARRAELEEGIERFLTHLRVLDDTHLARTVGEIFARRGREPQQASVETAGDLFLVNEKNKTLELARCVPISQIAGVADVQAAEEWRQETGAERVYLVAIAGFTSGAARLVRNLPVTLVEGHLLAHWQQTAAKENRNA